jgi:uncharacterized protein
VEILLIGATGMIGSRVAAEAVERGHEVTAASRSGGTDGLPEHSALTPVSLDAADPARVAEVAAGHHAVVSAISPPRDGTDPTAPLLDTYRALLAGVRDAGIQRLVVVGGAGSLEVAPGVALVDTPGFPPPYLAEARAHREVLTLLRQVTDLDWTYLSPAAEIGPGERTGSFRLGGDQLLTAEDGTSRISAEDLAVALVDELEKGEAIRRRITVAY